MPAQRDRDGIANASETTPLLDDPSRETLSKKDVEDELQDSDSVKDPRPNGAVTNNQAKDAGQRGRNVQIAILCLCALSDPLAYFAIFPFINEMIERVGGIPETSVGFYAGLIESIFSIVQMALMIIYGRLSDRLGRKPVLIFSLVGISVMVAAFGMSQTLWQMILLRSMCGLFGGSSVTIRTMVSENCTKETEGTAFSWFMFVRNLGIFIGPLIGGPLANPAVHFPYLFDTPFWRQYPYALSTYTAGICVISSAIIGAVFLKETLVRKVPGGPSVEPPMTTLEVLQSPRVPTTLFICAYVNVLTMAYTAVSPVFWYTSVKYGGFGFSDRQIAIFIGTAGLSQSAWMLLAFPPLHKRIGSVKILRLCSIGFPVFMGMYPFLNEFRRHGLESLFWVVAPMTVVLGSGVAMMFTSTQLMINAAAPSSNVLGTMSALALTVNNAVRAFIPIVSTSLFATGVQSGFADGHLFWIVLLIFAAGFIVSGRFVPEIEHEPAVRNRKKSEQAEVTEQHDNDSISQEQA